MKLPKQLRSLEGRLPLAMALPLVIVVVLLAWLAFREMRRMALDAAEERLDAASRQLATALGQGSATRLTEMRNWAADPSLAAFLSGGGADPTPVLDTLRATLPTNAQQASIELWTPSERRRRVGGASQWAGSPEERAALWRSIGDSGAVSPLRRRGDSLSYEIGAAVVTAGRVVGYLVDNRPMASSNQGRQLLEQLIGPGAIFRLGNADGSLWTDLAGVVPGPPASVIRRTGLVPYFSEAASDARLGVFSPIRGTPWVVLVAFPESAVLQRARQFLQQVGLIAVMLVFVGSIAVWELSRQLTTPLRRLATASQAIAVGNYSVRVDLKRDDELGRLAEAFNAMATTVHQTQHRLEDLVAERTAELHKTVQRLQETQEELVRREKLAMLGQLASGVGHELRNPLGVMTNAVYFLTAVMKDPPQRVTEYLAILKTQISISEKIVGDLLDFARVKTPAKERVELEKLVDLQLSRVVGMDGLKVDRAFPADLPPASADAVQLGQVVLNLITNAVQAMEGSPDSRLTFRGSLVAPGEVQLDVIDTGPGIAPEILSKIFEPLFTTKARGIGLGLAVSRSLVEANGGRLLVASEPGRGTTFSVRLPTGDTG